jgi:hypothetical protein
MLLFTAKTMFLLPMSASVPAKILHKNEVTSGSDSFYQVPTQRDPQKAEYSGVSRTLVIVIAKKMCSTRRGISTDLVVSRKIADSLPTDDSALHPPSWSCMITHRLSPYLFVYHCPVQAMALTVRRQDLRTNHL